MVETLTITLAIYSFISSLFNCLLMKRNLELRKMLKYEIELETVENMEELVEPSDDEGEGDFEEQYNEYVVTPRPKPLGFSEGYLAEYDDLSRTQMKRNSESKEPYKGFFS